jgi:hypothetical protein
MTMISALDQVTSVILQTENKKISISLRFVRLVLCSLRFGDCQEEVLSFRGNSRLQSRDHAALFFNLISSSGANL